MSANRSVLPALLLLAGCDKLASDGRSSHTGDPRVKLDVADESDNALTPEGVGAPMAWRRRDEPSGPIAVYGADANAPAFAIRCDRARHAILLSRTGSGTDMSIDIGNASQRYDARTTTSGGRRIEARVPDSDPFLDRLGARGTVFRVATGAEPVEIPSGVAIRRVVEECRAPPPPGGRAEPGGGWQRSRASARHYTATGVETR